MNSNSTKKMILLCIESMESHPPAKIKVSKNFSFHLHSFIHSKMNEKKTLTLKGDGICVCVCVFTLSSRNDKSETKKK